ncbi:unnamed protein product [Rangifer tarandus platyrhynchus]|uniref:Uncharacterized protein n=1 Tax=Rangifer tarandus platyrhynchus TaxID=3082113 RepID=A0AC59ZRX5_RANTA
MRTGSRPFPTPGKGRGRKPQRPERKRNCQDVRTRPLCRNYRIFQRKSCCQKGWECVIGGRLAGARLEHCSPAALTTFEQGISGQLAEKSLLH